MNPRPDDARGDGVADSTGDDLLSRLEERLPRAQDPFAALADVLGDRSRQRAELFRRSGEVVLDVTLGQILGAGGMGVTYAGTTAEGEDVAVKLVPAVTGGLERRFEQECRVLDSLRHVAIVRYRDHSVLDDGTGVLVMERVSGIDLDRLLADVELDASGWASPASGLLLDGISGGLQERRRSPRYQRRLLRLLAAVADGLHLAHEAGIVHRDVKPANILVRDDLSPVLIDFGLARDQQVKVSFTVSGAAMGTLAYMAPEQLARDPGSVDGRADIYALGLILYLGLLGEPLRRELGEVVEQSSRPFLLARRHAARLDLQLQGILYRCLDPRPRCRYQSAADLAADLRAAAGQGTVVARRPAAVRRFLRDRRSMARLSVGAPALIAVIVWLAWPRGRHVVFAGNWSPELGAVQLEDGTKHWLGQRLWLAYGEHEATVAGDSLAPTTCRFLVRPGEGDQSVGILTNSVDEGGFRADQLQGRAIVQLTSGYSRDQMAPAVPRDRRTIDGHEIADPAVFDESLLLAPGEHRLVAIDGRGRTEELTFSSSLQPLDVQLLPRVMADIDGSFRRTWSTVFSPLPEGVTWHGRVTAWLGPAEPSVLGGGGLQAALCALTPEAAGLYELELRVAFPEPMRSAVVYLRGHALRAQSLKVEAGFDGEDTRAWPMQDSDVAQSQAVSRSLLEPRLALTSVAGARGLVVRAWLDAERGPTRDLIDVGICDGKVFGGHWNDEPPCFAIVADPGDAAALPTARRAVPPSAKSLLLAEAGGVRHLLGVGEELVRIVPFVAADGGPEVLLAVQRDGVTGVIRRFSWPDLGLRDEILPEEFHERVSRADGRSCGAWLLPVPSPVYASPPDLLVGDPSSFRFGAESSGSVFLYSVADRRVLRTWPESVRPSLYGDDAWSHVAIAGDFRGDGRSCVAIGGYHAPGPDGEEKVGEVQVLDRDTGELVWQSFGPFPMARRELLDGLAAPDRTPALLMQDYGQTPAGQVHSRSLRIVVGGTEPQVVEGPELGYQAVARLAVDQHGAAIGIVALRFEPGASGFVGLERYEMRRGRCELVVRQPLDEPPITLQDRLVVTPRSLARIDDITGDGVMDFAIVLEHGGRHDFATPRVLLADGSGLGWIAQWVPGDRPDLQLWFADCCWMQAGNGAPAQLLVNTHELHDGQWRSVLRGLLLP
ncbi:MAG: serine/threonine protein kinase [Planctomycetes bacterium]|nr:serine/threonine protein kinase [Planctomycetota bacterium]